MGLGRNLSKEANVRTCFVQLPAPLVDWCDVALDVARVTIDMLPDVALLEIFHFYLDDEYDEYYEIEHLKNRVEAWHTLVHVCRTWRNIVFGSPRRLNLRLCIIEITPVRATLDIWPLLPIVLEVYIGPSYSSDESYDSSWDEDNVIAALEHNDRVCEIEFIDFPTSKSEKVLPAMHRPFPALTRLDLDFTDETPLQPDSFLGGSAPRLQKLTLRRFPFPGLPKLLLTATHLVHLDLWGIPHSGYFSPEAMVTALSMLTNLESLAIYFESPRSRPDWSRRPPPQTRTLLPILTELRFNGVDEYLEDLVARINTPLLDDLTITFFHQPIFDTAQLTQFISRTPKFKGHDKALVDISNGLVSVKILQTLDGMPCRRLCLGISCRESDLRLSSLAQVCSSFIPRALIHAVENLYIKNISWSRLHWQQDIVENSQWLDLLRPFSTVKCLYISREFAPRIAPALEELVGERVTEVLPALQTLFLEETNSSGPVQTVQEAIGQFVSARQLASHPVAVSKQMGVLYWNLHKLGIYYCHGK